MEHIVVLCVPVAETPRFFLLFELRIVVDSLHSFLVGSANG